MIYKRTITLSEEDDALLIAILDTAQDEEWDQEKRGQIFRILDQFSKQNLVKIMEDKDINPELKKEIDTAMNECDEEDK